MPAAGLGKRFFETTRGRIVVLLRRDVSTVEELARALALTDNAVRSHLATLERDGIVRQDGVRRGQGAGKPATLYTLHPEAEPFFSRAYAPMLGALLDELAEQFPRERTEALLRSVGRRLAARAPRTTGDLDARAEAAAAALEAPRCRSAGRAKGGRAPGSWMRVPSLGGDRASSGALSSGGVAPGRGHRRARARTLRARRAPAVLLHHRAADQVRPESGPQMNADRSKALTAPLQ
jgi:DNA-binding transcriptional ArsR family regulator